MSDYNGNGWGCGFGSDFLIVVLFLAMFGMNGWGGGWGNNGSGQTAAETAALVQQDNLRANVANNGAKLEWNTQLTGGAVQGIERTRDAVSDLDAKICAAVNNLTQQNNATNQRIADCCCENRMQIATLQNNLDSRFCATNQHITDAKSEILQQMAADRLAAVTAERDAYKTALAVQTAECNADRRHQETLAALQRSNACCSPCGTGCGNGNSDAIAALLGLSINIAQTQQAQGTTLNAIQTRVNQIPITAAGTTA